MTCQAPKDKIFGPRCGKPAVYKTRLGTLVCEDCGQRMKREHEEGKTVLSLLTGSSHFALYKIH